MTILVAGANGTTGRRIVELLSEHAQRAAAASAEGASVPVDAVRALVRAEDQFARQRRLGAEPVLGDLEDDEDVQEAVGGCDAVIFAAGSGAGTGLDKTRAVDRDGAIRLIDAAEEAGAERFVMLSSINADDPSRGSERMRPYYQAKHDADAHLQKSGLAYTIVRPGRLTNEQGAGTIRAAEQLDSHEGTIPRADVAHVIVASLARENLYGKAFEILDGDTPIGDALDAMGALSSGR